MTVGELAPERLALVLRTAAREFAEAGYEHASLNRIIAACAMSKSSFYHYFDSKAALFDTVVRRAMAGLAGDLAAPPPDSLSGPAFWDRLEQLAARVLELVARGDWRADAARLFYLPDAPADRSPAIREATAAIAAWFAGALAVGRSCGQVRDDLPAALEAMLVTDVVRGLDRWSLEHAAHVGVDRGALASLLVDLLRRLLVPSGAGASDG